MTTGALNVEGQTRPDPGAAFPGGVANVALDLGGTARANAANAEAADFGAARAGAADAGTAQAAGATRVDAPPDDATNTASAAQSTTGAVSAERGESGAVSAPASGHEVGDAAGSFTLPGAVLFAPQRLAELQTEYLLRLQSLMTGGLATEPADRRFSSPAWRGGPFGWAANLYLLNSEFMTKLADSVDGEAQTRDRVRFATQQWVDAMSPANYLATNPEAQRRLVESRGESLMQGVGLMLKDLQKGRITHTDESAFEVGRNMATTPGSVVFQNDLFQLIQYTPTTEKVARRPLVMVPPCINKFYILDLQPANSLVAWAVSQGHTVFMVSWKNIGTDLQRVTWDDYIEKGVIEALRRAREITDVERVNVLGFCVGGTLLSSAAAVLAGRGDRWIESLTLLTTFLDFSDPGVLGIFIDDKFVSRKERAIGNGGIMPGSELAATFTYLRPNDLVWNYVVSKYLKGEDPPPFDLLYWNSDGTNLPGPMFCWYLRHTYLQNELRIPGRLSNCGVPIDLGKIDVPTYLYASREDHIVPWKGAYASTGLLSGPLRFVLGASGHIAGVINPPAANKRSHWIGDSLPEQADDWFGAATEHRGSWWPDWARWLAEFGDGTRPAPATPGNERYEAIEPAPGSYVKQKAE